MSTLDKTSMEHEQKNVMENNVESYMNSVVNHLEKSNNIVHREIL